MNRSEQIEYWRKLRDTLGVQAFEPVDYFDDDNVIEENLIDRLRKKKRYHLAIIKLCRLEGGSGREAYAKVLELNKWLANPEKYLRYYKGSPTSLNRDPRRISFQGEMIFWQDLSGVYWGHPDYPFRVELVFENRERKYYTFKDEAEAKKQGERLGNFLLPD